MCVRERHQGKRRLTGHNRKLALVGIIPIKFSSLSAPTKIEELTVGSDEKTQRSPAGNRTQGLAKVENSHAVPVVAS